MLVLKNLDKLLSLRLASRCKERITELRGFFRDSFKVHVAFLF